MTDILWQLHWSDGLGKTIVGISTVQVLWDWLIKITCFIPRRLNYETGWMISECYYTELRLLTNQTIPERLSMEFWWWMDGWIIKNQKKRTKLWKSLFYSLSLATGFLISSQCHSMVRWINQCYVGIPILISLMDLVITDVTLWKSWIGMFSNGNRFIMIWLNRNIIKIF